MNIYNIIKEEYSKVIKENNSIDEEIDKIIKNAEKINLSSFTKSFNNKMKRDGIIKMLKIDYDNELSKINSSIASRFLNALSGKIGNGYEEVEFRNESKKPDNHFQMNLYGIVGLHTSIFIYVDDKHNVVSEKTKIEILDLRDGDNYFETLLTIE